MCANEDVCEEDKATQHRGFLGGSKISYSTPHRREAHTHTNQLRLHTVVRHNTKPSTHTRLISSTPSSTHTHGCWAQRQAFHTHTRLLGTTPSLPHTHTEKYAQTIARKKIICSVQHEQTWGSLD